MYSALAPFGMPAPAAPAGNFTEILERVWWRLDRALDEGSLAAAARLYAAEALLAGTTTLVDHHESPNLIEGSLDILADACDALGIRAVLCYGATERNGGRDEAEQGLAECRRFALANRRPFVRGVVGLHASFTVSNETLDEAARLCGELGTVVHVHLAEDVADLAHAHARRYRGPLERLVERGAVPEGSILAHGVHLEKDEVRVVAARGAWLVQNPRSNHGNRVGYPRALWVSDRVALGTDGYPADMRAERAFLEREAALHASLEHGGPGSAGARLEAGRRLAAERFGDDLADDVIELAPGAPDAARVTRVTVGGRTVVEDGALVRADIAELRARAREAAAALWPRMAGLP
jgi:cytosine/adenosine deaminase-related metal-dependent hydrolase